MQNAQDLQFSIRIYKQKMGKKLRLQRSDPCHKIANPFVYNTILHCQQRKHIIKHLHSYTSQHRPKTSWDMQGLPSRRIRQSPWRKFFKDNVQRAQNMTFHSQITTINFPPYAKSTPQLKRATATD